MLENKKHAFWQALFLTILFFSLGLVFGMYLEQNRVDEVNALFYRSESSLYDSFALGELLKDSDASCGVLRDASINFADQIYEEAKQLEQFDEVNQLTESVKVVHRKYDLLRTLLWINVLELKEKCNVNTVVYLYVYDTQDVDLRSRQVVWSRILSDLKETSPKEFILIPIATDQNIQSLNYFIGKYNVSEFPAVVINEKDVFYAHKTADQLVPYLK